MQWVVVQLGNIRGKVKSNASQKNLNLNVFFVEPKASKGLGLLISMWMVFGSNPAGIFPSFTDNNWEK